MGAIKQVRTSFGEHMARGFKGELQETGTANRALRISIDEAFTIFAGNFFQYLSKLSCSFNVYSDG